MEFTCLFSSINAAGKHFIDKKIDIFYSESEQGQDTAPRYISTRMVFFFMFLASVVLFESFRKVTLQYIANNL